MKAHLFHESITETLKEDPFHPEAKTISGIRLMLSSAIKFDIGEYYAIHAMAFGKQAELDAMRIYMALKTLPYDLVYFEFNHFQKSDRNKINTFGSIVRRRQDGNFSFFFMVKCGGVCGIVPIMQFIESDGTTAEIKVYTFPTCDLKDGQYMSDLSQLTTLAVVAFLELLECKNVNKKKIDQPKKLNEKRLKHGKPPIFSYYIAEISLPNEQAHSYAHGGQKISQRVHLCRGHIKTYTKDNPLFGRYVGKWWWQPTVRGDKKLGVIHKDYRVKGRTNASRKSGI